MLNGMSEQEFYDMYPTQEDWENAQQMKLGGLSGAPHNGQPTADQFFSYGSHYNDSINVPMGNPYYAAEGGTPYYGGPIRPYAEGGTDDNFIAPTNATKVATAPTNYNTLGTQGTKTFYDKKADIAKTSPVGTTQPSAQWEQSIIDRVKAGSSPEELVKAGHISAAQAGKYKQYYKPVYTETQPTTPPVTKGVPLADENKIDRKEVFGQNPYKTYQYPDVNAGYSKATMRYFDPKSNQEIDLNKSFDPKGNYIPSYLSNPTAGAEGTLTQTRYNTAIGSAATNPTGRVGTVSANMAYGGDYNSPTNYGSFNVPMGYGGMPMAQPGAQVNPEMLAFLQQRNPGNVKNIPSDARNYDAKGRDLSYLYPNNRLGLESQKFDTDSIVPIPNNPQFNAAYKSGKFVITGNTPQAGNQAAKINAGHLKQGKDKTVYADYSDLYKEDGGILDASNNQSYPMFNDGGRYNLLNLIKAASKKMKKAYGGDIVTQGGNSDNYAEGITNAFKKGIQNNTMMALMNEEQEGALYAVKQMGGYAGGYDNSYGQGPQLNQQNSAMQGMYQQRVDNMQSNVDQSGQDFMNAGKAFAQTYNPYTKTSVKAADGIQVLLNKQTGKPFTAEEYAEYQKYFGKDGSKETSTTSGDAKGNIYNYGPAQGMDYFPMNSRTRTKISKADDAMLRQLAANPTTNLKEYKNFNFGPFGRTKMKFGYKDIDPEFKPTGNKEYTPNNTTENKTKTNTNTNTETNSNKTESSNSRMTVEDMNKRGVYAPGMTVEDQLVSKLHRKQSEPKQGPVYQEKLTDDWNIDINKPMSIPSINSKAYGGGLYEYALAGETPISFPSWGSPIGGAAAPTPTPQSAGFGQNNIMMNGATDKPAPFTSGKTSGFEGSTGPEKEATVTQKRKTGLDREAAVNWGLAGMNMASSILEQNQDRSSEQLADSQIAGRAFLAKPANAMNQGDYNINSGDFRENQKVPVQFAGNTSPAYGTSFAEYGGYMQEGGEPDEEYYEDDLSDDEIAELRAQGYDVEYI